MIIEHILYILHILHIWNYYFDACLCPQVMTIAWPFTKQLLGILSESLTAEAEELAKILACSDIPVLTAYIDGVFRAAVRLWKFIMPREREAKDFFQTEVFHPASLDPNLQKHLGMTSGQRIFDMSICCTYSAYSAYLYVLTYFAYFQLAGQEVPVLLSPSSSKKQEV